MTVSFIINPTADQKQVSDMALTVASTREKVIMIEAGANEVPEQIMIEAIFKAHEVNQEIIKFIDTIVAECGKEKHTYESCAVPEELFTAEAQEIVNKTLATLPEQTRRIFIMSRYENKPYKEIAETLGMTTKGVEYHITQALKKLHINLKDYIPLFAFLSYMN